MFDWLTALVERGGAVGVALLMLAENVFPPIPSELIMPMAGFLAALGRLDLWAVIAAGTLGSVLGAWFWYWLGRALGRARLMRLVARWGHWATVSEAETEATLAWFALRGDWAVFLGRMVPVVRTLISLPAGINRMGQMRFLLFTAMGSLIWVSALTLAGWVLKAEYARVEAWLNPVTAFIVAAVVVTYLWRVIRLRARAREARAREAQAQARARKGS